MEIHPLGAELFHADGRADMTNLIVAFRNFANTTRGILVGSNCSEARVHQHQVLSVWSECV
jgi:hypothetical protein